MLEDARVLDGLVVALGHREDHDGQVLTQVKVDWADQVTHVFDKDDIDVIEPNGLVERVNGLHDHVALEVAQAARVDLDGRHAGFLHGDGVDVRGDIALDDGAAQAGLVAQTLVGAQNRGGLARTGARQDVNHIGVCLFKLLTQLICQALIARQNRRRDINRFLSHTWHSLLWPLYTPSPDG